MKKLTAALLCLALCLSAFPGALGAEAGRDLTFEIQLAGQLQALGLFQGTGDGGFELDRAPSRTEALVMLVRALGKGTEAEAHPKTHPFTDVPPWADGYVSYAWAQGLTKGVSDTRFGADDTATVETYLTFMLRALGYSDRWDFTWDTPWALAAWCGILPPTVDRRDFLRADAVTVSVAALYAGVKDSQLTLAETLEAAGVFSPAAFDEALPADPLGDYRALDEAVAAAVAGRVPVGQIAGDEYVSEAHILLETEEREGVIAVTALVHRCLGQILRDNTLGVAGYSAGNETADEKDGLCLIELDAETLEPQSCRNQAALTAAGLDPFSDRAKAEADTLMGWGGDWYLVHSLNARRMLYAGEIGYRESTYDEYMASLERIIGYYEFQRRETEACTVVLYGQGTPRGNIMSLLAVYKPGSALGDGKVVSLPLPDQWGSLFTSTEPVEFSLSGDGKTLTYSYHFDERLAFPGDSPEEERVAHEAGTYRYTTDLTTGETELEIVPDA